MKYADMPDGGEWMFCPSLNVRYNLYEGWALGGLVSSDGVLPEAKLMSRAVLPIDRYRNSAGNRGLRSSHLWNAELFAEHETDRYSVRVGARLDYENNPVVETVLNVGGGKWMTSFANGGRAVDFSPAVSARYDLLGKALQVRMAYAWHRLQTESVAKSYSRAEVEVFGQDGGWNYGASLITSERTLRGAVEVRRPFAGKVFASYGWKNLRVGLLWENPMCGDVAKSQVIMHGGADRSVRMVREYAKWGELKFSFRWNLSLSDVSTFYK